MLSVPALSELGRSLSEFQCSRLAEALGDPVLKTSETVKNENILAARKLPLL